MVLKFVGIVWKSIPGKFRHQIIRLSQKKFTVSVAVLILDKDDKVLLLEHLLRPYSSWGLPGGFIDVGEQPEAAIRREIREEIGLELRTLKLNRIRTLGSHIEILYTATIDGAPIVLSSEIKDLGWFYVNEMPEQVSSAQKLLISEIIASRVAV